MKSWSDREIKELKIKVSGQGKITIQGRSDAAICKKIYDLGLKQQYLKNRNKGKSNLRWSDEEVEMIKGGTMTIEGRSRCSIMHMRCNLGLQHARAPRPEWTPDKEELIKSLHEKGMSAKDMIKAGHFQDRSEMAVQKKLCRMGLVNKMKAKMPELARMRLKKFLAEKWEGRSTDELVEMWNQQSEHKVGNSAVVKHLKQMNLKVDRCEVQKINLLRKKEKRIMSEGASSQKILEEKIRALRVEMMRSRFERNKGVFTGMELEEHDKVFAETL